MSTTHIVAKGSAPATRVRTVREAIGLTREELAARAQISVSTVRNLEVRGVSPTRATRLLLAVALDRDVVDLFPERERPALNGPLGKVRDDGARSEPY